MDGLIAESYFFQATIVESATQRCPERLSNRLKGFQVFYERPLVVVVTASKQVVGEKEQNDGMSQ